jgi:hypothetical protein
MTWLDNHPELVEMRAALVRLSGYMSDHVRCAYAEAVVNSIVDGTGTRDKRVKVVVVSEVTRTFSFARRGMRMLLLELARDGHMTLLFDGSPDVLKHALQLERWRGPYGLSPEEAEELRYRFRNQDDGGAEPPQPPQPPQPPSDDSGGGDAGGLVEVVSHPVLFSVSLDDYQTMLENY